MISFWWAIAAFWLGGTLGVLVACMFAVSAREPPQIDVEPTRPMGNE